MPRFADWSSNQNRAYNHLRDDAQQPIVEEKHIQNLADLFVRHNAHKLLGIHLIHGHFKIPHGTVLLGFNFEQPRGRWAKVTPIEQIDLSTVHGHIFVVGEDGLCAYEYQESPLPDLSSVGRGFLDDLVGYLTEHCITGLIGLQVLGECNDQSMSELILDQGTVMLGSSAVKGCVSTRIIGWKFEMVDGNPRVCQSNERHAEMTSGNHKVSNAGKPLPKLDNVDDLKSALLEAGVL
ncbi:hypothetical protein ED733_001721 [Metarhizium rileyi]|uniref:Uncharacterized protein n=1 Tax=Metarhizium rileyi (strain RCEF 4871) TaxID=1649241 RepID=A0A5C6G888_METRR|nr:hypothetical protein ED733_001721 [Metarhizium rileyi]